jgi:hypothetical protein
MTSVRTDITDWPVGNSRQFDRDVTNVAPGRSLAKAWLTVKRNPEDTDAAAALQGTITPVTSGDGTITDTGAGDTVAHVTFTISAAKALVLRASQTYWWDISVLDDSGHKETLEWGQLIPAPAVTGATS